MTDIILSGLATGAITVLICSSSVGEKITDTIRHIIPRKLLLWYNGLLGCSFCASWWVSLVLLNRYTLQEWAATVAIANITILLIHWALTTEADNGFYELPEGEKTSETVH